MADERTLVESRVVGTEEVVPGAEETVVVHLQHQQKLLISTNSSQCASKIKSRNLKCFCFLGEPCCGESFAKILFLLA